MAADKPDTEATTPDESTTTDAPTPTEAQTPTTDDTALATGADVVEPIPTPLRGFYDQETGAFS